DRSMHGEAAPERVLTRSSCFAQDVEWLKLDDCYRNIWVLQEPATTISTRNVSPELRLRAPSCPNSPNQGHRHVTTRIDVIFAGERLLAVDGDSNPFTRLQKRSYRRP